jgi:hypothetical protein
MRRYLPTVYVLVGFALTVTTCLYVGHDPQPQPTPCTCSQLRETPATYAGKKVRVDLKGAFRGEGGVVWYHAVPGSPSVVLTFDGPVPDPLPASVVGYCRGPVHGGPVRVTGCRPD